MVLPVAFIYPPSDTPQGPDGVILLPTPMKTRPATKQTLEYVDGQNPFQAAKAAFDYTYPN